MEVSNGWERIAILALMEDIYREQFQVFFIGLSFSKTCVRVV